MMKNPVLGLQHIGLPSRCLEQTIAFYQSLGFTIAYETENPHDHARVVFLRMAGVTIEAWQSADAVQATGAIQHLALDVSDIDQAFAYVKQHCSGRLLNDEPQQLPYWENGVRYFTVEGPNAEWIEFSQYL